jgi:hypothetical protein
MAAGSIVAVAVARDKAVWVAVFPPHSYATHGRPVVPARPWFPA